jgi:predicted enzyme related to lactoylglutathione lyase
MKIQSVAFFCYPVSDIVRARAFYEGFLGLVVTKKFGDQFIEYDLGDTTFSIGTGEEGRTPGAPGGMVAFEVDDIHTWVNKVKLESVPVVMDLTETPVCHMFIISDPDKNGIMLHKLKAS